MEGKLSAWRSCRTADAALQCAHRLVGVARVRRGCRKSLLRAALLALLAAALCSTAALLRLAARTTYSRSDQARGVDWLAAMRPHRMNSAREEAIRLNELIAHPQTSCGGGAIELPDSFAICPSADDAALPRASNVFSLANQHERSCAFERRLLQDGVDKMTVLTAASNAECFRSLRDEHAGRLHTIDGHVCANASAGSHEHSFYDVSRARGPFTVVKLDFAAPNVNLPQCSHCKQLLAHLLSDGRTAAALASVRRIYIAVSLPNFDDADLIYEIYSALLTLFYRYDFALSDARQTGIGGRYLNNCRYYLTLLRVTADQRRIVQVPIAGLGSPTEEYSRLADMIRWSATRHDQRGCNNATALNAAVGSPPRRPDVWHVCADTLHANATGRCTAVVFLTTPCDVDGEPSDDLVRRLSGDNCDVYLYDPGVDTHTAAPAPRVHRVRAGVAGPKFTGGIDVPPAQCASDSGQSGPPAPWHMAPLTDLLHTPLSDHHTIDIMAADVHGEEWNLLQALVESGRVDSVRQFTGHFRVWYGGENENYRHYASLLWHVHKWTRLRLHSAHTVPSGYYTMRYAPLAPHYDCPVQPCSHFTWRHA